MASRKKLQSEEENRSPLAKEQLSMEFKPEGDAARTEEKKTTAPARKPRKKPAAKAPVKPQKEEPPETGVEKAAPKKRGRPPKRVEPPAQEPVAPPEVQQPTPQLLPQYVGDPQKDREEAPKNAPRTTRLPTTTAGGAVTSSTVPVDFPELERRSFWSRAFVILAMLAVLAASVLIFLFRPSDYTERTDSVNFFYLPDSNTTVIAVNGTVRGEVSGALQYKTYDGTGRVCAALVDDRLYLVKGRKVTEVATGVSDCVLSESGKTLAWRNTNSELFYMIIGKKDGTSRISGSTTDSRYCLSPDGKELLYTYERDGVLRIDVYSRTGNKPYLSQNEGLYPVSVTDDCRYLYYTDEAGALYVLVSKSGKSVLCGDTPELSSLIFNRDHSELLFRNGTETRMFVNGERLLLPTVLSTDSLELLANRRVAVREMRVGKQYLMESLCDNYYLHYKGTGTVLVYLEEKKDQGVLSDVYSVDGPESVTVTDKSVFFLSTAQGTAIHTNLYRCKTGKTEVEELYWDVSRFCTNVDGSRILFTDVHGALFSYRLDAFPERLCDSVIEDSMTVTADDAFYFYREEGKLWVSDNGDAPRAVREGVGFMMTDGMTAYYVTDITEDGCGTVYANYRNSRKDQKIADRVHAIQ